jgi:ABC-type branched-subunit amino acid transport system substrate-binding protein
VGGSAAAATRTASDVGITPDRITVGIPIPDVSSFGDVEGGASFGGQFGDPQAQWQAFIDDLNHRGGIGGRTVVPEYRLYDSIDLDSMRAACVYLTEQKRVFAVLGGFYGDPILCITQQHQTPLLGLASEADDFYQRSGGRFFSIGTSKDRVLRAFVKLLDADKALRGHTIGVLDQQGIDSATVDRTLLPELQRLGYRVGYHARIAADAGAAQAQIPIEVQRMRAAGVDVLLPVSGLIVATVFAQEADAQRYRPTYYLSDFASGATDVYAAAMPASFEGAIGYTAFRTGEARAGLPEPAGDAACRQTYERSAGKPLDPKILAYYYTVSYCGILRLFEQAMTRAGPNPTRAGFTAALQSIGSFQLAFGSTGSFGPGKPDAPDAVRRVTWRKSCTCWLPIDGFRDVRGL